jgi:pimeloyl-ACP methyl ester carboxylesterase
MMRRRLRHLLRWLLLLLLPMLLAACGGGSSDGEPPPPTAAEPSGPGRLESAAQISRIAVADVAAAINAPDSRTAGLVARYDVINHRLTYVTIDAQGQPIVASGLVSVPVKAGGATSPVLSFQHGTIEQDAEAPTNSVTAAAPSVVLASLGYIVVAPDYVGYGASKGAPHPYLLATPSAAAVIDLLTAAATWRQRNRVADNGQLFLIGYSEGGHATVAAHRALQSAGGAPLASLVAVAPGAGPYHVGVTLDELLRRVREANPLLGALVSPGLLRDLSPPLRREVRDQLLKRLLPDDADVVFDASLLDSYLADDRAAVERLGNVHDWAPTAPVRLYHGRDDQTVPYVASTTTLQAMRTRGAADVSLTDCTVSPSSHLGCVPPFLTFALAEFALRVRDL